MVKKKLNAFDVFMLIFTGIMYTDVIASNSSVGVPSLTWWAIIGVLYMIPIGFIIGELSGFLPGEGGIYVWIYEGLGPKWAAMTSWIFFCCGLFLPVSGFIMFSDILFELFYPAASFVIRVAVAILLTWLLAYVSTLPMVESQWLTNAAGLIKLALFVLCGVIGFVVIARGDAPASSFSMEALMPTLDQGLIYLPVIVFSCSGMEIASASAEEAENPSEVLPKMVIGCAACAIILNIFSGWGMLSVLPVDAIDLDLGLLDALSLGFGAKWIFYAAGIAMLFGMFVQNAAWAVGGNRGTCESAKAGDLPRFLAYERNGQPAGAILTTAAIGSVLLVLYALFAESAPDLFFSLLGCSVISSLLPYVFMIVAYHRLRKTDEYRSYDGFRCPAGIALSWLVQIIQCATLLLMLYVPGVGVNPDFGTNFFGAVGMLVTGLIAIWLARRERVHEKAESE